MSIERDIMVKNQRNKYYKLSLNNICVCAMYTVVKVGVGVQSAAEHVKIILKNEIFLPRDLNVLCRCMQLSQRRKIRGKREEGWLLVILKLVTGGSSCSKS